MFKLTFLSLVNVCVVCVCVVLSVVCCVFRVVTCMCVSACVLYAVVWCLYSHMMMYRIKLFHLTYAYLMELCGTDTTRALQILDWAKEDYPTQKVPVLLWNSLIRVQNSSLFFRLSKVVPRLLVSHVCYLHPQLYAKNNDMNAAVSVFEDMWKKGVKPHWSSFSALQGNNATLYALKQLF